MISYGDIPTFSLFVLSEKSLSIQRVWALRIISGLVLVGEDVDQSQPLVVGLEAGHLRGRQPFQILPPAGHPADGNVVCHGDGDDVASRVQPQAEVEPVG